MLQEQDIAQPAGKAVRVADSQNCRCLAKVSIGIDRKHVHIKTSVKCISGYTHVALP